MDDTFLITTEIYAWINASALEAGIRDLITPDRIGDHSFSAALTYERQRVRVRDGARQILTPAGNYTVWVVGSFSV
jgi:hypothetical protein